MKVSVLGVGLIGGSIGLAAKSRADARVTGFDSDPAALERAQSLGAIDEPADSIQQACNEAEIVICAGPVDSLEDLAAAAIEASGAGCAITDVGSVKRHLAGRFAAESRFVGGHPLAGVESVGVEGAREDLFQGARWFLTPEGETEGVIYDRLQRFLSEMGARPQAVEPAEHDRLMATVSHLPHLLANVLVDRAAASSQGEALPEVGPSFRDAARVAGENPALWADIYLRNGEEIAAEADAAADRLKEMAEAIRSGDRDALEQWQERAAVQRRSLLEGDLDGGPLVEVRVLVRNSPGVMAEIALALGKAGVNIEDMALYPVSDMSSGAISLFVSGDEDADRALECVAQLGHEAVKVNR
jgi:prephenate dehydrogenase